MRLTPSRMLVSLAVVVLAAGLTACGSSGGKKGGTLTVLNNGDFQHADPGAAYYQFDYMVDMATQRQLYTYKDDQTGEPPTPDLASGPYVISKDNKTVTIHLKKGIKFSPPVNREVTSADFKYAFERAFSANVPNGYVSLYYPLEGAPSKPTAGVKPISGIETPDKYTIVLKFAKPSALVGAEALVLPISAPVPKDYAAKYDKENPSTYDAHQVATGPYMIQNDASGKAVGWTPNKEIKLVRNPNWTKSSDPIRVGYADVIDFREGTDPTVGTKKVASGKDMITGDITPPANTLKQLTTTYKDQLENPELGSFRLVALNTSKPPFNDLNVRKAVIAGIDKTALRQARGGPTTGDIGTHFLPKGFPGYEEAGGPKTGADFMDGATANPAVSAKYFKAAGFASGKYSGPNKKITMTCDNSDPGKSVCLVTQDALTKMGFQPSVQSVPHEKTITICGIPKTEPDVCPNVGWFKDFYDPGTMLDNTFSGNAIVPENNSNWPQLNDPKINAAIAKADPLPNFADRVKAFAAIDKMIVAQAPGVPYLWDTLPAARSKNVKAVINRYIGVWDVANTSLK
jgi:peptide/nickel transport system substrate-binding protein